MDLTAPTTDATPRDWAILAVTQSLLATDGKATAEEIAAEADHLTVVSRIPGTNDWRPALDDDTQFVFLVDGRMQVGTFADYVARWQAAYYRGSRVSPEIRTWSGASFVVTVEYLGSEDVPLMQYRLSLGDIAHIVTVNSKL